MHLGKELNARSHLEIIKYSGGKVIGTIIDLIITFFLFGALTAMIAGTGALFEQQFSFPSILGNIVMAILTAITVLTGINGVINSISFVVPFLALSGNIQDIEKLEVPMIYIAGGVSSVAQIVYGIVLIAEVYTTAVGSLYGFISRITDIQKTPTKGKVIVIGATIAALAASQFGFSNLVKYLYPLVGYGGIVLLISLLYSRFIKKSLTKI